MLAVYDASQVQHCSVSVTWQSVDVFQHGSRLLGQHGRDDVSISYNSILLTLHHVRFLGHDTIMWMTHAQEASYEACCF